MEKLDHLRKKGITYLDTACMGLVAPAVIREIRRMLAKLEDFSYDNPLVRFEELHSFFPGAREKAAHLVGAAVEEIALVESTTHGLGLVAASLPIQRGNNILACDLEFFPTTLCWKTGQEKMGVEVRPVTTTKGEVKTADFEAQLDQNTRAIMVSAVQEANGFRVDLQELATLARNHDCYLIVDGIQEAGALQVDLSRIDVDVYCAGGAKWLCNPFGMGFLYVNRRIMEDLEPSFYGYFNTGEPSGGWNQYLASPQRTPFDPLELNRGAQKFETGGTGNCVGALGLYMALEVLLHEDPAEVEKKVFELNNVLCRGLALLNLNMTSSIRPRNRSGITTFTLPQGPLAEAQLVNELSNKEIYTTHRYTSGSGGIRVSPHYYNNIEDINNLLDTVELFAKRLP